MNMLRKEQMAAEILLMLREGALTTLSHTKCNKDFVDVDRRAALLNSRGKMDYSKIFIKDAKPTKIGGQAIMEGVMIRGGQQALAVRLPNGDKLEIEDIKTPS